MLIEKFNKSKVHISQQFILKIFIYIYLKIDIT